MKTKKYLNILQEQIHTVVIASIDKDNKPITCAIDIMLSDKNSLYFLTARGKSLYKRLMNCSYISLTGLKGEETMDCLAITIQGKVRNIKQQKLNEIFISNPYMTKIYPNKKSRNVLEVFQLYEGTGEFFDLRKKPIERFIFSLGDSKINKSGYLITNKCIKCLSCISICPAECIKSSKKYPFIKQNNCLHCGKCYEICPSNAIIRR